MLVRQQHSDSKILSNCRRVQEIIPSFSPILVGLNPSWKEGVYPETTGGSRSPVSPIGEDVIEIKELSQSPRASRSSMFFYSDTSPILSHKTLSDDSPVSSPDPVATDDTQVTKTTSPQVFNSCRYMVISELISTERKYIKNLNTILTVFMPAFEHVVAPRDLRLLIPAQLEMLVESHQSILDSLKERMNKETEFYDYVGEIFSRLCTHSNMEFFNMYRVYMGEFKLAMKTLVTYESESAQFKEILSLLQQSPLCERLSLASYLLTPIQRLPRYELLLKELMKNTPLEHPDNVYISEAISQLHKELTKLNLSIKSCEMACSVSRKNLIRSKGVSRRASRRAARTFAVLKRFVSAANIDGYSSGESSYNDDSSVQESILPRRFNTNINSVCDSDFDLTASFTSDVTGTSFRNSVLIGNRALSCSDLMLEFRNERQPPKLHNLSPLNSEVCTPNSLRYSSMGPESQRLYSSNSSLSSVDSKGVGYLEESLTPTEATSHQFKTPLFSSTPTAEAPGWKETSKDSTLTPNTNCKLSPADDIPDSKHSSKKRRRLKKAAVTLFRLKKSVSTKSSNASQGMKYIKQAHPITPQTTSRTTYS